MSEIPALERKKELRALGLACCRLSIQNPLRLARKTYAQSQAESFKFKLPKTTELNIQMTILKTLVALLMSLLNILSDAERTFILVG